MTFIVNVVKIGKRTKIVKSKQCCDDASAKKIVDSLIKRYSKPCYVVNVTEKVAFV